MRQKKFSTLLTLLLLLTMTLAACVPAAVPGGSESAPAAEAPAAGGGQEAAPPANPAESNAEPTDGNIQIPEIEEGKFNVAFVYVGPIGDGGWTYAHDEGRRYLEEQMADTVHTAYLESVPEGADAERVIRNLARKGFNAIFTTSFGVMDPTATVSEESMFPALRKMRRTFPTSLVAWKP